MKSLLLLLLLSLPSYSQKNIDTLYIKTKIDSLIASKLNENVNKYIRIKNDTSIMTIQDGKHTFPRSFEEGIKENEIFRGGTFYYTFQHPEMPDFGYFFNIQINEKFEFTTLPEFNFIPDFVLTGSKSSLISSEEVTKIAKKNISKKGIKMSKPKLEYDKDEKLLIYSVVNTFEEKKDKIGEIIFSDHEIIYIDAFCGKYLSTASGYFSTSAIKNK